MSDQQGKDGRSHLTYYDRTHALSFVWDGTAGEWIDVSYGGYAEPVFARIPFDRGNPYGPELVLQRFQNTCEDFVEMLHNVEATTIGHKP
jgi:hypothetical protein